MLQGLAGHGKDFRFYPEVEKPSQGFEQYCDLTQAVGNRMACMWGMGWTRLSLTPF